MGKLAEAYVDITGRRGHLDRTMSGVRADIERFAANMGKRLTLGVSLVGGASLALGTKLLLESVEAADDLAEAMNKLQVTFGESTGKVATEIDRLNRLFGSDRQVMADMYSNLGMIAQGAGLTASQAVDMAIALGSAADDATSLYNVNLPDALEKIRAGLVGESEPLRAFGIGIDEAKVQAEAMRLGLARTKGELDDTAKVTARASLILKGLGPAMGDHLKTLPSNTNQIRKLKGEWATLKQDLGKELMPAKENILASARNMGEAFREAFGTGPVTSFTSAVNDAAEAIRGASLVAKSAGSLMGGNDPANAQQSGGASAWSRWASRGSWLLSPGASFANGVGRNLGGKFAREGIAGVGGAILNAATLGPTIADAMAERDRAAARESSGRPNISSLVRELVAGRGETPGLVATMFGRAYNRVDYATSLMGMGLDGVRARMLESKDRGFTSQVFNDPTAARQSMQADALNNSSLSLQRRQVEQTDRLISAVNDVKEAIGQAAASGANRVGLILRGES